MVAIRLNAFNNLIGALPPLFIDNFPLSNLSNPTNSPIQFTKTASEDLFLWIFKIWIYFSHLFGYGEKTHVLKKFNKQLPYALNYPELTYTLIRGCVISLRRDCLFLKEKIREPKEHLPPVYDFSGKLILEKSQQIETRRAHLCKPIENDSIKNSTNSMKSKKISFLPPPFPKSEAIKNLDSKIKRFLKKIHSNLHLKIVIKMNKIVKKHVSRLAFSKLE